MRNLFLASLLGIMMSVSACNPSVNHTETTGSAVDSVNTDHAQSDSSKIIKQAYQSYLVLKDKLVKSEVQEAKAAATTLQSDLSLINGCEEAVSLAQQIANDDQIINQRIAFTDLSNDIITLVKGVPTGEKIFVQFCPMANAGKGGYWLSNKKAIENPYYGSEMLECGTVKETLN